MCLKLVNHMKVEKVEVVYITSSTLNEIKGLKKRKKIMRLGKVSYNTLKKSILRPITPRRKEVLVGAGIGRDSSVLSWDKDGVFVMSVNSICLDSRKAPIFAFYRVVNDLFASSATPIAISVEIIFPKKSEEMRMLQWMKQLDELCQAHNMEIIGGHTTVSMAVTMPILSLTAIGKREEKILEGAKAGQDIVITKTVGLEGSYLIAHYKKEELLKRYREEFLDGAEHFISKLSCQKECEIARKLGVSAMHNLSEGGVFGGLWELLDGANLGMNIDLKKIPMDQRTVEVSEYFNVNPYYLLSGGSMLMTTNNGNQLVEALHNEGIDAVVIGKVTEGNDRIIINEEEQRFLDLPKQDEIYKLDIIG